MESPSRQENENSLFKRAVWHSFKTFAALRIGTIAWVFVLSMLVREVAEPNALCRTSTLLSNNLSMGSLWTAWLRWDTVCYLMIAESGYSVHAGLSVWPPLYPHLIRLLAFIMPSLPAALIISNIAAWIAFTLLFLLVAESRDEAAAKNTLFLYAVFPAAFFLVAGYTESLFLTLTLGCLLTARRGKWLWAGLLAALAALTRNQGIVLSIVLLWEGILQYRASKEQSGVLLRVLVASSLPVLAFAGFSPYIRYGLEGGWPWQTLGHLWGQYSGFPWEGILGNAKRLLSISSSDDLYWLPSTVVDLSLAILILLVLAFNTRSGHSTYKVFAWMILLMSLMKLGPDDTLISFARYSLVIFPFFVDISPVLKYQYARLSLFALGLMLQALFLYLFYRWSWAG